MRISSAARKLLGDFGLTPEKLGWTGSERHPQVTVLTAAECRAAVRRGATYLLVLTRVEDPPCTELLRPGVPHQLVFAPFNAAELQARAQWLSHAREAAKADRPSEDMVSEVRLQNAGRVASFLSHETRNALSYAWTNATYIKEALQSGRIPDAELIAAATDAEEGISRALEAARTMLDLSRGERLTPCATDVNAVARRTVQLLTSRAHGTARVELALSDDVPQAMGHAAGLTQVLTNLLLNAQDAAGQTGLVRVSSAHEERDVALVVADNGPGLPADMQRKLFRAFNTTKERGTGLGLAVSSWIVQSLGGRLEAVPEGMLGGAEFRVVLPAA